ncbi:MAG: hypothetical protein A2908_00045 [Candidatus Staskawiczbacteria bacterium RIFCSPLOWO2_01_FULL_38_12b]|uniref:Uncharacterized protein n=1 Tax=Candidatus Staskawiczbacteria bacterium RIFCSPLOWO2_01_FULL_38_12b TaxID=1802214 RepID=A0A1G2IE79_9BACT|nr:MAG: hypothetical protein A2908_00045 [Candidatus Staskawiczbacteria bacterium RIFCSPLOWO2_01_FULL_38_12b]
MTPPIEENIQNSFDSTLKNANLESLAIDFGELGIDSLLGDSVFKNVPIVSIFISLAKFGANIHDKLFLKKILSFLCGLKDISAEDRGRVIKSIDDSKKYRVKVGEKLLYIIDSCHDFENSERVAQLFKAFIEEKISYEDFLETTNVLVKITDRDFKWFLKNAKNYLSAEDVGSLIGSGLFDLSYNPIDIRVKDEDDYKILRDGRGDKYKTEVDGGDMDTTISRAGEVIMEVFNSEYKKPRIVKLQKSA